MKKNILTLTNCAYIFHWSNNTYCYFGDRKEKAEINKVLKSLYHVSKKERTFEYHLNDNKPFINISGIEICVNDKMIESIRGEYFNKEVINNIAYKDFTKFVDENNKDFKPINKSSFDFTFWFYGKTFKSFEFEIFGIDSINCYRVHFNGFSYVFVCSDNKLYEKKDIFQEVTKSDIKRKLNIKSEKATKLLYKVLDFITE